MSKKQMFIDTSNDAVWSSTSISNRHIALTVLEKKEFVFISDSVYQNPHAELILSITFIGPKGEEIQLGW